MPGSHRAFRHAVSADDADHDVLSSTDANGNQTTNSYQYVGPNGSTGLITQTVQPKIQAYTRRDCVAAR